VRERELEGLGQGGVDASPSEVSKQAWASSSPSLCVRQGEDKPEAAVLGFANAEETAKLA